MESFSMIDIVVKELEKDANLTRIKKVIYCACEGRWENDESKLSEINLRELIEELYNKVGNIETLDRKLSRIVSKVNKRIEYSILAQKILGIVGKLYPEEEDEEDMTIMETGPNWSIDGSEDQTNSKDKFLVEESYSRDPGELFNVREKIIQNTNPLKAKILIFSTVEHQFSFSERDWLLLKTKSLDSLLRQIFNLCSSTTDLEVYLYSNANNFENPDEYMQVANVIISALTSCYAEDITVTQVRVKAENYQISPSDTNDINSNDYFQKIGIDQKFPKEPEIMNHHNEEEEESTTSFESSKEDIDNESTDQEESTNIVQPIDYYKAVNSIPTKAKVVTQGHYKKAALRERNILDSIKQKLEIENEISALVNQRVDIIIDAIEAQFISLEESLNNLLEYEPEERRLSFKYTALASLISNVQDKSTKFREILMQLETDERKIVNFEHYNNGINQEVNLPKESYSGNSNNGINQETNLPKESYSGNSNNGMNQETNLPKESYSGNSNNGMNQETNLPKETDNENQQKIIELATQGNPKAIAMIINKSFEQQGITVIAGKKNDCLHIVLESEQVPNKEIVTPVVQQKITNLQSEELKNVKIHGRQSGNKSIIWTQTISV
ncbi:hypothetical protein [Okeania sp.]|uniref:hypothetical protein n=1 Tax=Okeania sp. TaxID=3100323 RepID=UPI002B4B44B4|nr:hypothetical protein [Okeania sp.]MEB3339634.1 hypothetical protein [Okeania sp.]